MIRLLIWRLNYELQVFSFYITSVERSFNDVTDYVKKVEG